MIYDNRRVDRCISNVFVPWLNKQKIDRPALLFINGHVWLHSCPSSFKIMELRSSLIISKFNTLNTTLGCGGVQTVNWNLKNHWKKLGIENCGNIFENASCSITKETIQNGIKRCGKYPFNVRMKRWRGIIKECLAVLQKSFLR